MIEIGIVCLSMEFFKRKESATEIPKNYQEAFKDLGNKLIFNEPFDEAISKENVVQISQKIQKEFLSLDERHQKAIGKNINFEIITPMTEEDAEKFGGVFGEILKNAVKKQVDISFDYEKMYEKMMQQHLALSEKNFLIEKTSHIGIYSTFYEGWGFTPKLANYLDWDDKDPGFKVARNCFGNAQTLGAYCKLKGIKIDMGIAADHPLIIAYLEDGVYRADAGRLKKLEGTLVEESSYKIYRPVPEDKLHDKMIMIHDFDKALVYELLENMEVLRQLSLGEKSLTLPKQYDGGMSIASKNKDILQKINWKDLQFRLFPEIAASFSVHNKEWSEEVEHMRTLRKEWYIDEIFEKATYIGKNATHFKEMGFQKAQELMIEESRTHREDIVKFLKEDMQFKENVSENIKNFFTAFKEEIKKENEPDVIDEAYKIIENVLFDKKTE